MAEVSSTPMTDADAPLCVLLADAHDDTREMYRVMFEQFGVELDEAVDGRSRWPRRSNVRTM